MSLSVGTMQAVPGLLPGQGSRFKGTTGLGMERKGRLGAQLLRARFKVQEFKVQGSRVGEGTWHGRRGHATFKVQDRFSALSLRHISYTREELLDALPCMGNTQQRPGARDDSDDEDRRTRSDAKNTRRHTPKHSLLRAVNERGLRGRTCHLDNALQRLTSNRARRVELNKAHLGQVDQIVNIRRLIRSDGRVSRSADRSLPCVFSFAFCAF